MTAELETRTICTFIAAQAGMWMELKKGERNPMLDAAQSISFFKKPSTPEEVELDKMRGERVADRLEDDPRFKPQKEDRTALIPMNDGTQMPRWLLEGDDVADTNPDGSYERLMGGWGRSAHGQAIDTRSGKGG
jgi:hypothetical protein